MYVILKSSFLHEIPSRDGASSSILYSWRSVSVEGYTSLDTIARNDSLPVDESI